MANTYTYTARSARDPERVLTFTLYEDTLSVNLTGVLESLEQVAAAESRGDEAKKQLKTQFKPTTLKVVEKLSGPVHLGDVNVDLDDDGRFTLKSWKRVAGLRLAPLNISIGPVDNPEAAKAFIAELEQRRAASAHPSKFFGPLDYWFGWVGLVLAAVILIRWPRRES